MGRTLALSVEGRKFECLVGSSQRLKNYHLHVASLVSIHHWISRTGLVGPVLV